MTPEEAVKVASLVGELWPATPLDGTRKAFYANALTSIPVIDMAIKAVHELFVTERFQPTPGEVIDLALGVNEQAALEWQRAAQAATELQSRVPTSTAVDATTSAILRRLCGGIGSLPISDWRQMDRMRTKFIDEYTVVTRRNYHKESTQRELGT